MLCWLVWKSTWPAFVQNFLCSEFHLSRIFFVKNFLWSEFSLFRIFFVQNFLCSEFSLFRIFFVQIFLWSEFSLVRIFFVQIFLCREQQLPLWLKHLETWPVEIIMVCDHEWHVPCFTRCCCCFPGRLRRVDGSSKIRAMVEVRAEAGEEEDSPARCQKRMGASSESLWPFWDWSRDRGEKDLSASRHNQTSAGPYDDETNTPDRGRSECAPLGLCNRS